ncbi:hypothetical protein D3C76_1437810 [compost metagenome]
MNSREYAGLYMQGGPASGRLTAEPAAYNDHQRAQAFAAGADQLQNALGKLRFFWNILITGH